MKTVKLITDKNIENIDQLIEDFEKEAMAEVHEIKEVLHFNGVRKSFEVYTYVTFCPAGLED